MHGNEHVGLRVFEKVINEIKIIKGTFRFVIANPTAISNNVRFMETDLNRSFPGKKNGSMEEGLAINILDICKNSDVLIDFHSCPTPTLPFCLTRGRKEEMNLSLLTGIERNVIYPLEFQKGSSLIDFVPLGIGVELGSHLETKATEIGLSCIRNILSEYSLINQSTHKLKKKQVSYKIYDNIIKKGKVTLSKEVENFKLISKGTIFAVDDGKELIANESFYPILFADRKYNNLLGLKANLYNN
jgi:succinylglutamate desuccinylase